jgi:alpha-tubulin suppressor-like RCC1 family protein
MYRIYFKGNQMKKYLNLGLSALLLSVYLPVALADVISVTPVTLFPATLAIGNTSTATYQVTNNSNVAVHNVQLLPMPSKYSFITENTEASSCKSNGTLAAKESCKIVLKIAGIAAGNKITGAEKLPQVMVNDYSVANPALPEQRLNVTAITPVTGVTATVSQALPDNMTDGSQHDVTVVFNNTSAVTLTGISTTLTVSDDFVKTGDTCGASLAAGGQCQVDAKYTAPIDSSGAIALSVTLSASQISSNVVAALSSNITNVVVTGSAIVPLPKYINQGVSYFVGYKFTNASTQYAATGVGVTVPTIVGLTITENTCPSGNGTLAASASCDIKGTYKPPAAATGTITISPSLSYAQGNAVTFNSSDVITSATMKCWGDNNKGQLGDGSTADRSTPVDVVGLSSGVIAITGGTGHSCALLSTGAVKCWGYNGEGGLGDGSTTDRFTPVDVHTSATNSSPLSGVLAIIAGAFHSCALLKTGTMKCWGSNSKGDLGNNSTTKSLTPVDVHTSATDSSPLSGIVAITTGGLRYGEGHTCALLQTGLLKCWGANDIGQLGDGSTTDRFTPVDVHTSATNSSPLSGVVAVRGGGFYNCALLQTGTMKCWGNNNTGALGNGTETPSTTPLDVHTSAADSSPLSGVVAITTGFAHTCALLQMGTVKCWGYNASGQLGDGSTTDRFTPVDVHTSATNSSPLSGVVAIAAASFYTCALLQTGEVKCWGSSTTKSLTPVDVRTSATDSSPLSGIVAISGRGGHTCALRTLS